MESLSALILLGLAVVGFVVVARLSEKVNISMPFVLSAVVGGAVVAELVMTGSLLSAFPGSGAFGFLTQYGTGVLVATTGVVIVFWWYIRAWVIEGRRDADRATQSVVRQAEGFAETWFTTWRVLAVALVGIGALFLGELGTFLGEFPLAVANVATIALGYVQLGGVVPYVGGAISTLFPAMSAEQWLLATAILFIGGVVVRNS